MSAKTHKKSRSIMEDMIMKKLVSAVRLKILELFDLRMRVRNLLKRKKLYPGFLIGLARSRTHY